MIHRTFPARVAAAGVLALAACASAVAPHQVPTDMLPKLSVPRIADAPTIDGSIGEGEWQSACAVSGVAAFADNMLHPRPTTFYLAWDAGNLYLACRAWVMPGYGKPRVSGRSDRAANVRDDGLELVFHPQGRNVPPGRPDMAFKCMINALGFGGDYTRVSVGQQVRNWLPDFTTAIRLTEEGSAPDGGRWWEIEVKMPADGFELDGPNRAGDAWRIMLGFNHMSNQFMQTRVPANSSYLDTSGHCLVELVEDAPAVQVLMEKMPGPSDGMAAAQVRVHNPTDQPATVTFHAEYTELQAPESKKDAETPVELITRDKELTVPPGQTARWELSDKLPRAIEGKNRGRIFYEVTEGKRELFRYCVYFRSTYPEKFVRAEPRKTPFTLSAALNPVAGTVQVEADAYYLPEPDAADRLAYRVTSPDGEVLAAGEITEPVTYYFRRIVELPGLSPGKHVIEATLHMADGSTRGPVTRTFTKLDEGEVYADWWDNDLGDWKQVIPPYEGVRREDEAVKVLARTYRLNAAGLPDHIVSNGGEVLASPARLVVTVDGTDHGADLSAAPVYTDEQIWRLRFDGEASAGGLAFDVTGWVEQDGLCWLRLTYAPAGDEPVTVDGLRIEFPLANDVAECIVVIGPGSNFSAHTFDVLPADRQGTLWTTLDTGLAGSGMTIGSFYPVVWVGNEQRGFLWWGDSDRGWDPHDEHPAHTLRRDGEQVILANHILPTEFTVTAPRSVEISYNATPFRPLPKGWRATIRSRDGTFKGPHKGRTDPDTDKYVDAWYWIAPPDYDPDDWGELWAEFKAEGDAKVDKHLPFDPERARHRAYTHTSIPLIGYPHSGQFDIYNYFRAAWGSRGGNFGKTHQDYTLWLCDRAFGEGGIRTIYWDLFFPTPDRHLQSGNGYVLPDGRAQPGYFGWNLRRFMMRLYALNHKHGIYPGGNVAHATNAYYLVATPWMDAILDGEQHELVDGSTADWVDGWPRDRMRALACSHNWGTHICWMDAIRFRKEKHRTWPIRNGKFEYIRLFDSWGTHNYEILTTPILQWGINDEDTEFVPFWRNPYVTVEDDDVMVSMWKKDDRVLLGVFNYDGEKKKDISFRIDMDALGLIPQRKWQDFLRVEPLDEGERFHDDGKWKARPKLDWDTRTLTVPNVLPHRGRYISIRLY